MKTAVTVESGCYKGRNDGKSEIKVYFVRHARPDTSVRDDALRPLTEKGISDSKGVADVLKDKNITAIYSSPFKRAYDTVKCLADTIGLGIKVIDDFRERKVADRWIDDFKGFAKRQWEDFSFKLEQGECLQEVQKRNVAALNSVLEDLSNQAQEMGTVPEGRQINIVVGTHGTALGTITNHYNPDFGFEDFWAMADKMPYILCMSFEDMDYKGMEEVSS